MSTKINIVSIGKKTVFGPGGAQDDSTRSPLKNSQVGRAIQL
jgi:hypothetical protein